MRFLKKKKYLTFILLAIFFLGISVTIYLVQQSTDNRSRATAASTLSFSPSSTSTQPVVKKVNDIVEFDVLLNQGSNLVSSIRLGIEYDKALFAPPDDGKTFIVNPSSFGKVLQPPIDSPGLINLSVATTNIREYSNPERKIGTLRLKIIALDPNPSEIKIAPDTQVLSAGEESQSSENVLASSTPAYVLTTDPTTISGKTCTIVSDTSTKVTGGGNAVNAYNENKLWIVSIPGATWIWSSYQVLDPKVEDTREFTREFTLKGPVTKATLDIASDNTHVFSLNGNQLFADTTGRTFGNATPVSHDLTSELKDGTNSIAIKVTNWARPEAIPPANPAGLLYKLTVTAADCNVSEEPTQPPPTNSTKLDFSVLMHGIGAAGDNVLPKPEACQKINNKPANPQECYSNQVPLHPERDIKVEIYNTDNALQKSVEGKITYASSSGTFKGSIDLGTNWVSGPYNIHVQSPRYLRRRVSGFHTITAEKAYIVPVSDLIAADVDEDNKLTVLDYSLIIACYTLPDLPSPCAAEKAAKVDINDDGNVDEFDENLFRREIIAQPGDK